MTDQNTMKIKEISKSHDSGRKKQILVSKKKNTMWTSYTIMNDSFKRKIFNRRKLQIKIRSL